MQNNLCTCLSGSFHHINYLKVCLSGSLSLLSTAHRKRGCVRVQMLSKLVQQCKHRSISSPEPTKRTVPYLTWKNLYTTTQALRKLTKLIPKLSTFVCEGRALSAPHCQSWVCEELLCHQHQHPGTVWIPCSQHLTNLEEKKQATIDESLWRWNADG